MGEMPDKGFIHEKDYFIATLEQGELVMKPFCSCGNFLDDNYFCGACNKQCLCTTILCTDGETLQRVKLFIDQSSSFKRFKASLIP